jgi:hypothetical protein
MRALVLISALTSISLAGAPLMPAPEPYADEYVLVRKDVWDKVDGSDRKLEACERELASADADIKSQDRALKSYKMATNILKEQKVELKKFGDDMAATARMQREYIVALEDYSNDKPTPTFAEQAAPAFGSQP